MLTERREIKAIFRICSKPTETLSMGQGAFWLLKYFCILIILVLILCSDPAHMHAERSGCAQWYISLIHVDNWEVFFGIVEYKVLSFRIQLVSIKLIEARALPSSRI